MNTKICNQCKVEKPLFEFYFRKDRQQYRTICEKCINEYQKQYKQQNKDSLKKWYNDYYEKNTEKIREYSKTRYLKNIEYYQDYRQQWYQENKENHNNYMKEWYQKNKQRLNAKHKLRRQNDPSYKILCNLRRRLCHALQDNKKILKTIDLLGCTIIEFKEYLESKFQPNMTWDNYGKGGWHIDHIIPCVIFDLTDPIEQKQCFHYSNLQPLWEKENQSKGKKIDYSSTK